MIFFIVRVFGSILFYGVRGLNSGHYIYYALSISTELNLRRRVFGSIVRTSNFLYQSFSVLLNKDSCVTILINHYIFFGDNFAAKFLLFTRHNKDLKRESKVSSQFIYITTIII